MIKRLGLMFILILILGGINAEISNVQIEPQYPNLNSNLIKICADFSNVSSASLFYQIIGDSEVSDDVNFSAPFFGKCTGIVNYNPKDNTVINYQIASYDSSGNIAGITQLSSFAYDGTPPKTTDDAPESTNHDIIVTLSCTDPVSGCSQTYYSINGSDFVSYFGSFVLSMVGEYQLKYYSIDNAGNNETSKEKLVSITPSSRAPVSPPSGGQGGSYSASNSESNPTIIINDTQNASTVEIVNSDKFPPIDVETKGKITGKSIVGFIGENKGISIFIGILIIIVIAGVSFIKRRIKRKLWGK